MRDAWRSIPAAGRHRSRWVLGRTVPARHPESVSGGVAGLIRASRGLRRGGNAMPPHSLDQAYGHVIEAAARNVRRLVAASDLAQLAVEAEHLVHVTDL